MEPDPFSCNVSSVLLLQLSTLQILSLVLLPFLLLFLFLFAGAERAFFSLPPETTNQYRLSKKSSEKVIFKLLERPRRTLATILFAKTVTAIIFLVGSLFIFWHFTGLTPENGTLTFLIILALFFIILFITEVLPKVFFSHSPSGFTRFFAPLLSVIRVVFSPVIFLFLTLETAIYSRFNLRNGRSAIEDLQEALDEAIPEESSYEQKEILKGLVTFGSISVKQIMCARLDITAFGANLTLPELIPLISEWGYSRVPVYRESLDEIEGILYIKDLLPYLDEPAGFNWQKLVRPPFFVPESKKIDDLLKDFQDMHVHMAVVVDEYGGTSGLITLEDIIEEIVGDIKDEFDDEDELEYTQLTENTFIFDAKTSLYNLCRITGTSYEKLEVAKGENETLAGLMLELFSRIPRKGARTKLLNYTFTIDSADTKKVKSVIVHVQPDKENTVV